LVERRLKDDPTTLEEMSQHCGVSRERVRQIEIRALEKLRESMKAQFAAREIHASAPKSMLVQRPIARY
jgi:RNA polymerase sigma-32 factor